MMSGMANWTIVRLELGQTRDFPQGSPLRHYLLSLPLREDSTIDEQVQAAQPHHVTVRRFWPQEPDRRGHLVKVSLGWAFSYMASGQDGPHFCQLRDHAFVPQETVTIAEAPSLSLPFCVAEMSAR